MVYYLMVWILIAAQLSIPHTDYRTQVRCEVGCQGAGYDTGLWIPKKKVCLCADEFDLRDLFLKKYPVKQMVSPPEVI